MHSERKTCRTALVTGGGRGLGRAFAVTLARAGMSVAVIARTTRELDETVRIIRAEGHTACAFAADVTRENEVRAAVAQAKTAMGSIDLLVNNAGAGEPFGPVWETAPDEWWRTLEVNLKGPMLCSHAVLPGMIRRGGGRIVNIASGAGAVAIPHMSAYVTSKTALIRFTEVLAEEVRAHGVSVFAMQPGTVRTAMAENALGSDAGRKWLPWFRQIFEEGRNDSTEPGASLLAYLASGGADQLSGRFFVAPGDAEAVVARAKEILDRDLHVLRIGY